MHFAVQKELLVKALKDVSNALASRIVQPILSNIVIESIDATTLKFGATDLDLAIQAKCSAVVYTPGAITLPGRKLLEIVSKLPNDLVSFQVEKETSEAHITCQRSKFMLSGLLADDFPTIVESHSAEGFSMPSDILRKAIVQTSFAAASFETANILTGVSFLIKDGVFEVGATDGSRLAHRREELRVEAPAAKKTDDDGKEQAGQVATATMDKPFELKAVVPARALTELLKLLDPREIFTVRIAVVESQITFETQWHFLSSRLIAGEYPRYQDLFPTECTYLARFNREEASKALDRVAVVADERTHLIKLHFEGDTLKLLANAPDVGNAEEELPVHFEGQVIDHLINVGYVLDVLQRLTSDEVVLEMTGPLKPLIFKDAEDEKYRYLLMPVQIK